MKKITLFIALLLALLISLPCGSQAEEEPISIAALDDFFGAGGMSKLAGVDVAAGATCDATNIYYWLRMETDDISSGTGDDSNNSAANCGDGGNATGTDCSSTDEILSLQGGATITTGAVKLGTYGMDLQAFDYFQIAPVELTMGDEGRFGFWLRLETFQTGRIFRLYQSDFNELILSFDGTEELSLYLDAHPTVDETITTTTVDLVANGTTWYYVEIAYDFSTNYMEILTDGSSKALFTPGTLGDFQTDPTALNVGSGASPQDIHIDQFIWSSDSTQDLYTTCSDTLDYPY